MIGCRGQQIVQRGLLLCQRLVQIATTTLYQSTRIKLGGLLKTVQTIGRGLYLIQNIATLCIFLYPGWDNIRLTYKTSRLVHEQLECCMVTEMCQLSAIASWSAGTDFPTAVVSEGGQLYTSLASQTLLTSLMREKEGLAKVTFDYQSKSDQQNLIGQLKTDQHSQWFCGIHTYSIRWAVHAPTHYYSN